MVIHTVHPYIVTTAMSPPPDSILTYGIQNVVTGVTEAYVSQLAKAIWIADTYARELKEGIVSDKDAALGLLKALKQYGDTGPEGSLN